MDNPISKIHLFQDRLRKLAESLGLSLEHTMWVPGLDAEKDHTILQCFLKVSDGALQSEDEEMNQLFESIVDNLDGEIDPLDAVREKLRKDMETHAGLGFDELEEDEEDG